MSRASKVKLVVAVMSVVPAAYAGAQSLSYVSFGGPGTAYTQDFNTLPFGIANTTVGFSGTAGSATIFRNNPVGSYGALYDLGSTAQDPTTTSILWDAFQSQAVNTYPLSVVFTGTVASVTATASVTPVLTASQATQAFNRAATTLKGWSVGNYLASTASTTSAFRFIADNGNFSNAASVRSFGPLARDAGGNGFVQNGTVVATGATFDATSTDTTAFPFEDRALGAVGSGTGNNLISLTLRNDSQSIISSVNIATAVEEWRHGTTATDTFRGSYMITDGAPDPTLYQTDTGATGTFTRAAQMDLFSTMPNLATQNAGLNGNSLSYTSTASVPVTWLPGQYLVLRYVDLDSPGTDDGNAIDNFTVTATGATVAPGARFLTYTGAQSNAVVVGGAMNFVSNGASASLATGDVITLDNTGLGRPNLAVDPAGISISQLNVSSTGGTYTISGGGISTIVGLIKTGAGTVVLNNGANDFGSFGLRATGGVVQFGNANQLGNPTVPVILSGGAVLASVVTTPIDLSANTVSLSGTGGGVSNAGALTLGNLSGSGAFEKAGPGNLVLNNYFATGGFRISAGTVTMAIPASQQMNLQNTDGSTVNGDLVLAGPIRINLNTVSTVNGGQGGVIGGSGHIYADVSGATIATIDSGSFFTSIQVPIVLNRNNVPNFQFNIFPGFAGASRLQVDAPISGPNGTAANADLNFAAGPVYGAGSVVINQSLSYTGKTTINVIGGTSGGVTGGGFVVLGLDNALPVTTTLGFNTVPGFNQGSSGSGYLSLGNSVKGAGFSQQLAGLYSGNGDAPLTSFTDVATAFGGIANTTTATDPIATRLTLNIAAGNTFTYTGQLFGLFSLVKTGPGTQRLGAVYFGDGSGGVPQTSNYTGTTEIKQGSIEAFGGADRLSPNAPLVLGDTAGGTTGTLVLAGISQTVAALASSPSPSNFIVANLGSVNGTVTQTATLKILSQDFGDTTFFPQDRYRDFLTTTFAGALADGTAQLSIIKTATQTATDAPTSSLGELRLTGSLAYSGNTTVNGGKVVITSPLRPLQVNPATTLGSVTVTGSSTLAIGVPSSTTSVIAAQVKAINVTGGGVLALHVVSRAATAANVVVTGQLAVDTSSFVDLGTNDLIVKGGAGQIGAISAAISNWYAGGARNGLGLGSSALAQGADFASLTTLGAIIDSDGRGGSLFSSFDGVAVTSSDVLVMYTYRGDADLSGLVDASDLANLFTGMSGGLSGWQNGDTNYDGVVDMTDFGNLLLSLQGQGGSLGGDRGAGVSGAVPEPSMLGVMAVVPAVLARRRRR